jgi:hypothetical protein
LQLMATKCNGGQRRQRHRARVNSEEMFYF